MKIIVTGSAGFIGFFTSVRLLELDHEVIGIDNLDDYYSEELKLARLKILQNKSNFSFLNLDINDLADKTIKADLVLNFAAQPGVRITFNNWKKYADSNINGFKHVLDFCVKNNVPKLIYASSSSVYGNNQKVPFAESDILDKPKNFYAYSKQSNESLAEIYSKQFSISCIGLRFFTVYGPYGRPDMAYFNFTNSIFKNEKITKFNSGKLSRDMTFIDDIVDGIESSINLHSDTKHLVFNLGNDSPISVNQLISKLEKLIGRKAIIRNIKNDNEVLITHADLDFSESMLNYTPKINVDDGLSRFVDWYKSFYRY